jgi:hypothetical protein
MKAATLHISTGPYLAVVMIVWVGLAVGVWLGLRFGPTDVDAESIKEGGGDE